MVEHYVFIDPDGMQSDYLFVIVNEKTGVVYGNQCEGLLTSIRTAEGFLIPLDGANYAYSLKRYFAKFEGYPPGVARGTDWDIHDMDELSRIISEIPMWATQIDGQKEDVRTFLKLDKARTSELTEGWIPVITPYGKGILVFENCD